MRTPSWGNTVGTMNTRNKLSLVLFAAGLAVAGFGVATGQHGWTFAGVLAIAVTLRYRKRAPAWNYLAFLVLGVVVGALVPPGSPMAGAIPLLFSYILDSVDERRQRRVAGASGAAAPAGHVEAGAATLGDLPTPKENPGGTGGRVVNG